MIFSPEYLIAMAIGFFGSLHCLGMCGPIALVTPAPFPGPAGRVVGGLLYNSGRIVMYFFLGILAGLLGTTFVFFKWQQGISLILGTLILLYLLVPGTLSFFNTKPAYLNVNKLVKNKLGLLLKKKSAGRIFAIGLLNGLLPCGLVYMGLAGSIDMGDSLRGGIFMAFFGLGTWPMMTGLHLMGYQSNNKFRNKLSRLLPVFVFIMGIMFLLRGMGLGIAYLSPSYDPHTGDIHCTSPAHRHN